MNILDEKYVDGINKDSVFDATINELLHKFDLNIRKKEVWWNCEIAIAHLDYAKKLKCKDVRGDFFKSQTVLIELVLPQGAQLGIHFKVKQ